MDKLKKSRLEGRIGRLRSLVLKAPDVHSCGRHDFGHYLSLVFRDDDLSDRKIAEDMGYVVTSVRRWKDGRSCPHKALWPQIVSWIKDEVEQKIIEAERDCVVVGDDVGAPFPPTQRYKKSAAIPSGPIAAHAAVR